MIVSTSGICVARVTYCMIWILSLSFRKRSKTHDLVTTCARELRNLRWRTENTGNVAVLSRVCFSTRMLDRFSKVFELLV